MLLSALLLILANPEPQDIPPYFIKIIQQRTLFANDESVMLTIRLGNQLEKPVRSRKWPDILKNLTVTKGDETLKLSPKADIKARYKKAGTLKYGAHKDFRLNMKRYFPQMNESGIFRVVYKDKHYEIAAEPISIANVPRPDLNVRYRVNTSMGNFTMELDEDQAPNHVRNFALLVSMQFYQDMIFHRVSHNFVIQTGDPLGDGTGGSGFPLNLERSPFLKHEKYAVGMARGEEENSATSQFYVCLNRIEELDDNYTIFGKVVDGFDVIDAIGTVPTTGPNGQPADRPNSDVKLIKIETVPK